MEKRTENTILFWNEWKSQLWFPFSGKVKEYFQELFLIHGNNTFHDFQTFFQIKAKLMLKT